MLIETYFENILKCHYNIFKKKVSFNQNVFYLNIVHSLSLSLSQGVATLFSRRFNQAFFCRLKLEKTAFRGKPEFLLLQNFTKGNLISSTICSFLNAVKMLDFQSFEKQH